MKFNILKYLLRLGYWKPLIPWKINELILPIIPIIERKRAKKDKNLVNLLTVSFSLIPPSLLFLIIFSNSSKSIKLFFIEIKEIIKLIKIIGHVVGNPEGLIFIQLKLIFIFKIIEEKPFTNNTNKFINLNYRIDNNIK
ncbi:MAG: hypothetical protein AD073_000329 [Mycoplasmataceae bacterium]|nr:MAG: hypothetical protein AD073_000329 [Mycoplasmataceae bacterium]